MLKGIDMATSFATVTSTAPRITLGRSFPMPPVAHLALKIVRSRTSAVPTQETAFDLETPINQLTSGKSRREDAADESIFSQGDEANAVFYIQSGKVKLTVVSMSGKEAVIAYLTPGRFLGETSL